MTVRIEGRQFSSSRGDCPMQAKCLNCGHTAGQHYYLEIRNTEYHKGECSYCKQDKPCPQLVPDTPEFRAIMAEQIELALHHDRPDIEDYIERYLEGII